ncbi:MAG TPA: mechanosensitive ion channel domain-containing protein, partial [Telmatospirillum sp.]|nr:mechanosensitive ion channel domain-containing protein [Telmatospirillum sp.]
MSSSHALAAETVPVNAASGGDHSSAANKADVERLISVIEDPQGRQKLVSQLKLLIAADKSGQESDDPGLLSLISDKVQDLSDDVLATATALADVGHLVDWLGRQASDPKLRATWVDVLGKLAATLCGGLIVEWLMKLLLRRPRRLLENHRTTNRWLRVPFAAGRGVLELLPIAAFILAAHVLQSIPPLTQSGDARQATVMVVMAYVLVRFLLVLVQAVLMPGSASIRFVPFDDETATYLFIWARRMIFTGVWGYFLVQALKLLGLPKSGYNFSLKMLGLVVGTLLVILVLQNRQSVSVWIRSRGLKTVLSGKIERLRDRLADVWHVLASLYIIASFAIWALQVKGGFDFIVQASILTVVILVAANLLVGVLARLVERAFSISDDLRRQFPQLESRANRYLTVMHNMVRGTVVLLTLLALAQAWGANTVAWLTSDIGRRLITSTVSIVAVLIGALIFWELVNASIERYLARTDADGRTVERSARVRTLLPLLRNVIMVVLMVVVALIVLSELGINTAPLLAGAGVVGVAIGFGSQKLVQDVITGAFILFENTIAVGDTVKIADHTGTVEGMTIRTMRLRDATGQVHTLPFSNVASVINLSRDFGFHVFELGVSYREDIDSVIEVIKELGEEMRNDAEIGLHLIDPIEVFGIDKFTDSAVVIGGRFKTLPGKQWTVGREFNRRIKKRFDADGILLPYPTTTLFFGEDHRGKAP